MPYIHALFAGAVVGGLYAALRVKAPAPPIIALAGLAGMLVAAQILGA
jgi:XapX domain-containing protein